MVSLCGAWRFPPRLPGWCPRCVWLWALPRGSAGSWTPGMGLPWCQLGRSLQLWSLGVPEGKLALLAPAHGSAADMPRTASCK